VITEPVTVEFTLTKAEYLAAIRTVYRRSRAMQALVGAIVVLFVLPAIVLGDVTLGVTGIVELGLLWWFADGLPRRRWRRQPYLQAPRRITVDGDGVRERNQRGEAFATWDAIVSVRHLRAAYYFWVSRNCVVELPDRVLSPAERDRLAPLVAGR